MKLTVLVFSNPDTSPKACTRPAYGPESVTTPRSMPSSMRRPMFKSSFKSALTGLLLAAPIVAVPFIAAPSSGLAIESRHCLTGEEQRAATANGKTVPLAAVIHTLHRAPKDVIKAQLCQEPDRLIYMLTLLGRDGKVKRAIVDATSGAVVGER
jgi:hypothetical protein